MDRCRQCIGPCDAHRDNFPQYPEAPGTEIADGMYPISSICVYIRIRLAVANFHAHFTKGPLPGYKMPFEPVPGVPVDGGRSGGDIAVDVFAARGKRQGQLGLYCVQHRRVGGTGHTGSIAPVAGSLIHFELEAAHLGRSGPGRGQDHKKNKKLFHDADVYKDRPPEPPHCLGGAGIRDPPLTGLMVFTGNM